jgi:hypothetical protein
MTRRLTRLARRHSDRSRQTWRLRTAVAVWLAAMTLQLPVAGAPPAAADVSAAMEKFLAYSADSRQYRGKRWLEASGSGQHGWMEVTTDFSRDSGLQYDVISEGGSGYIRKRVLRSLLDEEQELIARGVSSQTALSIANYDFQPDGVDQHGFALVRMQPLRKQKALIIGQLVLSPANGELLRVEGRLAKNPSFWVTRATIVRSYRHINGVRMPVSLDSTAQLRFLGASTLRMTYYYSEIDEQPVGQAADEPAEPGRSLS